MSNRRQRRVKQRTDKARRRPLTAQEMRALQAGMRQVYIWRYSAEASAQARADEGLAPDCDVHGYSLLAPATPAKTDAAYALAKNTLLLWQVIQIAYCVDAQGVEFKLWSWVRSNQPIVAAGDGILPLLHRSYSDCMEDLREDERCVARAVIMAPWDSRHPIRPELLAAKLKTRLKLTDHEIRELGDWSEPFTATIEEGETLDLELAQALRDIGESPGRES